MLNVWRCRNVNSRYFIEIGPNNEILFVIESHIVVQAETLLLLPSSHVIMWICFEQMEFKFCKLSFFQITVGRRFF